MCSLPLPCQHGSHHPFLSKDANVIEYLLTVSGKMKNSRKAIALEPLSQLHKKSSRNIPGTFFMQLREGLKGNGFSGIFHFP